MSNSAKDKRDALKSLIETTLQNYDKRYTVEDRLRRGTMSGDRAGRTAIMGEHYTYAEVLGPANVTTSDDRRTARGTTYKKVHSFTINVWLKYEDAGNYLDSSRKKWDDAIWDDQAGLLPILENTPQIEKNGVRYTLGAPLEVEAEEKVNLDAQMDELAHYANFRILVYDA